jgi:endo-1,4-beta-xylanase
VAEANGLRSRGHPLIWGRLALPSYVLDETDPDALRTMMRERIMTIVTRYRGRIAQYDVVNEPITLFGAAGETNGLEPYVFYRLLGPGYIREALEMAHAADPDAALYVNDFFVERPGDKQDRFFDLIKRLVDEGAPIHGVGFQGHVQLPGLGPTFLPTREELEAAIRRFAGLGLDVEITEVDVTLADRSACELDFQRRVYTDIMRACLAVPACTGVTTWGISDQYTWIKNFFSVDGAPLLFDESFQPKPAYFGVRNALLERICAGEPCAASCLDRCGTAQGCPEAPPEGCVR